MIHKINSDKQFTLPVDFRYCPLAIYIALRRPMLLGSVTTPVVRGSGKPSFFGARVVVDAACSQEVSMHWTFCTPLLVSIGISRSRRCERGGAGRAYSFCVDACSLLSRQPLVRFRTEPNSSPEAGSASERKRAL